MAKFPQMAFSAGEIDPLLHARVDLERFTVAAASLRNFFVLHTGGVSNRAGLQFVYALNADSLAKLLPFIRSENDAYMLVLQEENIKVFRNGTYIDGTSATITNASGVLVGLTLYVRFTTSAAHGFIGGDTVTLTDIIGTGSFGELNGSWIIHSVTSTTFDIQLNWDTGAYTSGGTATKALALTTSYQSDELSAIRATQSADVMTLVHRGYLPSEVTRTDVTAFTFAEIDDFNTGPFLPLNDTAVTMKASANTGTGITITASSATFTANHIGALIILYIEDLSSIPPWESGKSITTGDHRLSDGKVYEANNTATTGGIAPSHDTGAQLDGDAGVEWEYLHSLFGVARITAQASTTATADVLSTLPFEVPGTDTTTKWALGAWSEDQGYPGVVTYFSDRLSFARSLKQPQTEWTSKTGDYHNFSISSPQADDDAVTQTLNSRQTNDIVEMIPLEQLVSLTANSTWATPARGEILSPSTVGFFPQTQKGAADLPAVIAGDSAVYAERFARRIRELRYDYQSDRFGGQELTTLARHLFRDDDDYIVDMAYAEEPFGILWVVLFSGKLVAMTYLPEQQVVAWSHHETDGYFENVCVIPEDGRDAVYFIVQRTVNGSDVRYLERLANRSDDELDAFFVDAGLTYDGRNTTATTMTISGSSYDGGDSVTITASSASFASTDVGDAIQLGDVDILITAYTSTTVVTGELQSPLDSAYQATATATWTFARDTFSGLDHLEGETITGLADGNKIDPDDTTTAGVVTGGQIVLNYPAGVVHIGLAYIQQIQTLNINVAGNGQIRGNAKLVPKVDIITYKTAGLKVGPDEDNLEELNSRSFESYGSPVTLQTGVATGYPITTWDKSSSVLIEQNAPKPATILAVIPTVVVGNDG